MFEWSEPQLMIRNAVRRFVEAEIAAEKKGEARKAGGGNGYMSEHVVEQLARDSNVLQIYAGTDEIQIRAVAKDLLTGVSA